MPRQRVDYSRGAYVFPDDFPQRLVRFKEASGLSWAELARRLGTFPLTVRRWWKLGVRPNTRHMMALLELAESMGLAHLFTTRQDSCEGRLARVGQTAATPCPGGKGGVDRRAASVRGDKRKRARAHRERGERR